ncbi:transposase [Komagataeibacter rhaeticus]|uniref:Transposase n=1 Tax=Komagataeibacter rhaeticus TaxID=215221 RepID=A0A858JM08_9PROT|nr:transposase [Komagataeibacter rhaeticus]
MAWTEITRAQYRRDDLEYASDLRDAEWALIAPLIADLIPEHTRAHANLMPPAAPKRRGRPPKHGAIDHLNG